MRRLEYLSCRLDRSRRDLSHNPLICYVKALFHYCWYKVLRYYRPGKSFFVLLHAHFLLIKGQRFKVPECRLMIAVEDAIGREFGPGGPAHSYLHDRIALVASDLPFLLAAGGIVLKTPRVNGGRVVEKGALLLNFAENFRSFRRSVDMDLVLRDYVLILEPGWSGLSDFDFLYFTRFPEHPIIVMAAEKRDYQFFERLGTNLIPVRYACCDLINPAIFHPIENMEKKYDAAMIATWLPFKRHHVLFRALRKMRDRTFRVALLSHMPQNREEIELLIDGYGVRENLTLFEGVSQEKVNKILNQSKVNILLSLQEGASRALFEGFFAGVPGLALRNQVGIRKEHFTPQTGKLIAEKDLCSELLFFREHWHEFIPRSWAMANITPDITTSGLNEILKRLALKRGEEWTRDLVAKSNSPNSAYYPDASVGEGFPSMKEIIVRYAKSTKIRDMVNAAGAG